jgi:hypothetical protein
MIGLVDEFVILDNVQFTKNDWRNRNRIPDGKDGLWLTIPVRTAKRMNQPINEAEISDPRWARKHWSTLSQCYARAPHFKTYEAPIRDAYERASGEKLLSAVNRTFIATLCNLLGVKTKISDAEWIDTEDKTERVVRLCQSRSATRYLSGPAAKHYVDDTLFEKAGITLEYMDYAGYPPYKQLHAAYDPAVSVLDLLFNTGPEAPRYMKFSGR